MDPNETLKQLRQLAGHVIGTVDAVDDYTDRAVLHDLTEEAENMAELFQALDGWIKNGGFLPEAWRKN